MRVFVTRDNEIANYMVRRVAPRWDHTYWDERNGSWLMEIHPNMADKLGIEPMDGGPESIGEYELQETCFKAVDRG